MSEAEKKEGWWANAFAVERTDSGGVEPNERQRVMLDRVCEEIVRRKLTTPALLFLEMSKPLNYVSAQALHFFHPIVAAVFNAEGYRQFAEYLEKRGSIEWMCRRLEATEARLAAGGRSGDKSAEES